MKYIPFFIIAIVFGAILAFGAHSLGQADNNAFEGERQRQQQMESHIGQQIQIGHEIHTIVDFDFWGRYVLENGQKINPAYVNNQHQ